MTKKGMFKNANPWTSLAVQWLRPRASSSRGGTGLIPGQGSSASHRVQPKKKQKKKSKTLTNKNRRNLPYSYKYHLKFL